VHSANEFRRVSVLFAVTAKTIQTKIPEVGGGCSEAGGVKSNIVL
jgi:hypothetical protein